MTMFGGMPGASATVLDSATTTLHQNATDTGSVNLMMHNLMMQLTYHVPSEHASRSPRARAVGLFCRFVTAMVIGHTVLDGGRAESQSTQVQSPLPHIVLILADDMGYGDPGCYNRESKVSTPNLDALARRGLRFTDAHSPESYCIPTRYGLLTGRYACRTHYQIETRPAIEAHQPTVATLLQAQGYQTAMVGKWHLGLTRSAAPQWHGALEGGPLDHGFERFWGIHASLDIPPYFTIRDRQAETLPMQRVAASSTTGWSPIQGAFWRAGEQAPDFDHAQVLEQIQAESCRIITQHQGPQPLFLYVALTAPHTPWLPHPSFRGRSQAGLYGDFVMQTDHVVGQILASLQAAGHADNTLVLFTSDNGPVWYEADRQRFGHSAAGPFRGMKMDSYEGGHRIPWIVRWPGHVPENSTSAALVCHTDLMATLAEICQVPLSFPHDSVSFLSVLSDPQVPSPRSQLVLRKDASVVRRGAWKLITHLGSGGFTPPRHEPSDKGGPQGQLYDLSQDPGESHNLWQEQPQVVQELLTIARQHTAKHH